MSEKMVPVSEFIKTCPNVFAENDRLKQFRDRYQKEEKEKSYNQGFECLMQFARVMKSMPDYINEIMHRDIPIEEKDKHIRMVFDLAESVRETELKKYNEIIYTANMKNIGDNGQKAA